MKIPIGWKRGVSSSLNWASAADQNGGRGSCDAELTDKRCPSLAGARPSDKPLQTF